jgi:hypothetical protein
MRFITIFELENWALTNTVSIQQENKKWFIVKRPDEVYEFFSFFTKSKSVDLFEFVFELNGLL